MNKPASVPEQFDVGRRGRRLRRAVHAAPAAPARASRCEVLESADDVGGTWYWNRYPGRPLRHPDHRLHVLASTPSWRRSGRGRRSTPPSRRSCATSSTSPTSYDLRRDIRVLAPRVDAAAWDDAGSTVDDHAPTRGDDVTCRFYVMATGCLSMPKAPDIEGADRFAGRGVLHQPLAARGRRLHRQAGRRHRHRLVGHPVDPAHRRAGRRSSPCSSARRTSRSRRTTARSRPDRAGAASTATATAYRDAAKWSRGGVPGRADRRSRGVAVAARSSRERFEAAWEAGELFAHPRRLRRPGASTRRPTTIVGRVDPREDPLDRRRPGDRRGAVPEGPLLRHQAAVPRHRLLRDVQPAARAARRPAQARRSPRITETGIETADESFEFDAIVYATGFDAMTGAIVGGRHHRPGRRHAEGQVGRTGPTTYLGLMTAGFPNFFMITGPGQPVGAVEHGRVDRAARRLGRRLPRATCATQGFETIEPTETAEAGWVQHVNDCADITLYPTANSWYMGANVPGKPRVFLPYVGGVDAYRQACDEVVDAGLPRLRARPARAARSATTASIRRAAARRRDGARA